MVARLVTAACVAVCIMPGPADASAPASASASVSAPHDQAIAEFAAAMAARDSERERERERERRRIKGGRIGLIAGAGVTVIGAAILIGIFRPGRDVDVDSPWGMIAGSALACAGLLTMAVSGPMFVISRNRLGELGEPQRRILRLRPSLVAGTRGGQAGLVLDLRF